MGLGLTRSIIISHVFKQMHKEVSSHLPLIHMTRFVSHLAFRK